MKQKSGALELVTKGFLKETIGALRDEIMTKLASIVGELETIREDRVIGVYQTREFREQVNNHEKRIKHLEKTQQTK